MKIKLLYRIVLFFLAVMFLLTACQKEDYDSVDNTTWKPILERREKLPYDTTSEKASNPFAPYQTVEGKLYLLVQDDILCSFSEDKDEKNVIKKGVKQFLVYGDRIYYVKKPEGYEEEITVPFYEFYSSNREGRDEKRIASHIVSFGVNEEENMLYYFGKLGKDCVRKLDLTTGETISVSDGGVLYDWDETKTVRFCFRNNKVYFADGSSSITEVDLTTGEENYFNNEKLHYPDIREVYVKGDCLYYAVEDTYCFSNQGNQTGVWKRDLETGEISNISSQKAAYFYSVNDMVSWQNLEKNDIFGQFWRRNKSDSEERKEEEERYIEKIETEIGIADLDHARMLEGEDTHDGFLGDGETRILIQLSEENAKEMEQKLSQSKDWNPCPMEQESGTIEEDEWFLHTREIKSGYYRIQDDNGGNDYSSNYSLVVFDSDKNQLYYYRQDT